MGEQKEVLRGLTLKVYKFVLRSERPVGIREVQRALNLSSPTLALYHMNKLEEAGLIKKEANGYIADRVILENLIRFRRILIPRNFFYMIFLITSLIMLAVFLRPPILTRDYIFSLVVISVAAATSVYETVKVFSHEVS
ncbi:MAG: helix-turn-helix domain-containing protein [Candidatus Bathyarchaeia archaeon]